MAAQGHDVVVFRLFENGAEVADGGEGVDGVAVKGDLEHLIVAHFRISGPQASRMSAISAAGRWCP